MAKVIAAELDRKGNVIVPEHILHDNGVRELDGVFYGHGKPQFHPPGCRRVTSNTEGESLTKQSFADEADIQNIVKRALRGQPVTQTDKVAQYVDVSNLPSYMESLNTINALNQAFMSLDGLQRAAFHNNPENMVAFLSDPANYEKAVKLGILDPSVLTPVKQTKAAEAAEVEPKARQVEGA